MALSNVRDIILKLLRQKGFVRVTDATGATGFSRAYVHRFFRQLTDEGKLALVGKANQARYIPAKRAEVRRAKQQISEVHRILRDKNLTEDRVLDEIKDRSGIFFRLPENVTRIVDYAFLELLNNAIEHSQSPVIEVWMKRRQAGIYFRVLDKGVGIFRNIMMKKNLKNETEAIQDLLKGKQTTDPDRHSGEGIFFTSKSGDRLVIKGSGKKLIYDNVIEDIIIDDGRIQKGTEAEFWISLRSKRSLHDVFAEYAGAAFEFGKTLVTVELYRIGQRYVSRSQARRILGGLEKFKEVVLDFKNVGSVGQGFADELFRVWQRKHPDIHFTVRHASENVVLMIQHVQRTGNL